MNGRVVWIDHSGRVTESAQNIMLSIPPEQTSPGWQHIPWCPRNFITTLASNGDQFKSSYSEFNSDSIRFDSIHSFFYSSPSVKIGTWAPLPRPVQKATIKLIIFFYIFSWSQPLTLVGRILTQDTGDRWPVTRIQLEKVFERKTSWSLRKKARSRSIVIFIEFRCDYLLSCLLCIKYRPDKTDIQQKTTNSTIYSMSSASGWKTGLEVKLLVNGSLNGKLEISSFYRSSRDNGESDLFD